MQAGLCGKSVSQSCLGIHSGGLSYTFFATAEVSIHTSHPPLFPTMPMIPLSGRRYGHRAMPLEELHRALADRVRDTAIKELAGTAPLETAENHGTPYDCAHF